MGRDFSKSPDYSEQTSQEIDAEVRRIINEQYSRARALLETHIDVLKRIAMALLEYETIDGEEIKLLLAGKDMPRLKPTIRIRSREDLDESRAQAALLPPPLTPSPA